MDCSGHVRKVQSEHSRTFLHYVMHCMRGVVHYVGSVMYYMRPLFMGINTQGASFGEYLNLNPLCKKTV